MHHSARSATRTVRSCRTTLIRELVRQNLPSAADVIPSIPCVGCLPCSLGA